MSDENEVARCDGAILTSATALTAVGIVALFGASATTTVLALGIAYIPFYTRLVRGAVVSVRGRAYVDASRVLGSSGESTMSGRCSRTT